MVISTPGYCHGCHEHVEERNCEGMCLRCSMDYHNQQAAMDLEQYLVPVTEELRKELPSAALKVYDDGIAKKIPTGIAIHPDGSVYVLMAGQGPMIAWEESQ